MCTQVLRFLKLYLKEVYDFFDGIDVYKLFTSRGLRYNKHKIRPDRSPQTTKSFWFCKSIHKCWGYSYGTVRVPTFCTKNDIETSINYMPTRVPIKLPLCGTNIYRTSILRDYQVIWHYHLIISNSAMWKRLQNVYSQIKQSTLNPLSQSIWQQQVRYVLQSARKCSCVDTVRKQKQLLGRWLFVCLKCTVFLCPLHGES